MSHFHPVGLRGSGPSGPVPHILPSVIGGRRIATPVSRAVEAGYPTRPETRSGGYVVGFPSTGLQWAFCRFPPHTEPPSASPELARPYPRPGMASGYNLPRLPELDGFFGPSQIGQPVMDRQSPLKRKAEEVVSATLESARKVAKTFETPESSNTVSPEFTPPKTPTPRAADPGEEELRALARELVEHLDNHLMARLPFPPPAPYRLVEGPDGRHLQYVTPPWAPDPDEADKARREAADKEAAKRARALEKADAKRTVVEGGAGEKPASPSSPSIRGGSSSTRTRNESPPTVASSPPVQVGMTLRSCSRRASAVPVGGAAHESGPSKRSLAAQRRWKRDRENATSSGLPLKQWGRK